MAVQALQSLEQKKRDAAQELNLVARNLQEHSSGAAAVCIEDLIPCDTAVTCEVTANCHALQLELAFATNNRCVIKGVVIFAEGLFSGESLFVHPAQPATTLAVPVKPEKDCAVDMLVKVRLQMLSGFPGWLFCKGTFFKLACRSVPRISVGLLMFRFYLQNRDCYLGVRVYEYE